MNLRDLREDDQIRALYCDMFNSNHLGQPGRGRVIRDKWGTREQIFKSFLILNKALKYINKSLWRNNDEIIFFYKNIDQKKYRNNYNYIVYYSNYHIYALFFNNYLIAYFRASTDSDHEIFIFHPAEHANNRKHKNLLNNIDAFIKIINNNILFLNLTYTHINNNFKLY